MCCIVALCTFLLQFTDELSKSYTRDSMMSYSNLVKQIH